MKVFFQDCLKVDSNFALKNRILEKVFCQGMLVLMKVFFLFNTVIKDSLAII